jgi:adenine phosphoribosyltransferase
MDSGYLRLVDRQTTGNRCDVTPLFADATAFWQLLEDLKCQLTGSEFDAVAAVDALGFILGTALAVRMHKGVIPVRKGGKLPVRTEFAEFVDYTGTRKSLELRPDAIRPGMRLLLVDEWVETGAQVRAAISLIERCGGVVVGVASINIDANAKANLQQLGYPCFAVTDL